MVPSATAFFCFCVVAVYSIDGEGSAKFKRDVGSGLVSFPRIGRSENRLWKIGTQDLKRSLVSFPRTGKRNLADLPDADNPQRADVLWLAARSEVSGKPWAVIQLKDFPVLMPRTGKDAERLIGESSEDTG